MAFVVLGYDGADEDAPARRLASRDEHVAFITAEAKAGRLALGLPLHDEAAHSIGSLMVLDVPDRAGSLAYMAQEPFARSVWRRTAVHPFRIAPLPYAAWPSPGSAMPGPRSHTVLIALDGTDEGAPARRQAVRPAHFARVTPLAEDGTLLLGGAILDAPDGAMIGSIAVTRHMDHDAAKRFWAEDPYVTGEVWKQITFYATLLRPLPYKPLPR